MNWFTNWWMGLNLLQQSFAIVAVPATVILFLQTLMLLFGLGHSHDLDHGVDHDFDHDVGHDFGHDSGHDIGHDFDHSGVHDGDHDAHDGAHHDSAHHISGLRIFTVRGIVAFFAVGGWLGIVLGETSLPTVPVLLISLAGGTAALIIIALLLRWSLSLQDEGNLDLHNAIGKTAQVYIPIPADGASAGKVNLVLQERFVELPAITRSHTPLRTDQVVKITGIINQNTLLVKPIGSDTDPENTKSF